MSADVPLFFSAAAPGRDPSREKAILENPRLRSNESPSGAFKRQSGLRKQMEGLCPDKLRRFSRIAK